VVVGTFLKWSYTKGNREFYEKKLEVISAIDDIQIKKPHHIPVSVYIKEADTLSHLALQDKGGKMVPGKLFSVNYFYLQTKRECGFSRIFTKINYQPLFILAKQ